MCGSMADIQSTAAEIRRGKKKKEEERKKDRNHRMKIYMVSLLHRATIKNTFVSQNVIHHKFVTLTVHHTDFLLDSKTLQHVVHTNFLVLSVLLLLILQLYLSEYDPSNYISVVTKMT